MKPSSSRKNTIASSSSAPSKPVVFLLDWDDTLFPTTDVHRTGIFWQNIDGNNSKDYKKDLSANFVKELETLEAKVLSLLQSATNIGRVYIVTASEGDWVQVSAQRLFPAVHAFIEDEKNSIQVISVPNGTKQGDFNGQQWKKTAFYRVLHATFHNMADPKLGANVLVIGDSIDEINAAREVETILVDKKKNDVVMKTTKLMDAPAIKQLRKQITLVVNGLDNMVSYPRYHADLSQNI